MYDLRVEGIRDFGRSTLFARKTINRDPMGGVLDGTNRTFRTTYYPIQSSGSISFFVSSGSALGLSADSIDYDSGTVVFATSPAYQPYASYTYSQLTDDEVVDILMAGFDEMQSRWSDRAFYLSSSNSAFAQAVGTESHIYIVTKDGSSVSDPTCGGLAFSTVRVQIAFYMLCCEYRYMATKADVLAGTAFRFSEARGPSVDQSRIPINMEAALQRLDDRLKKVQELAEAQHYTGTEPWGGYVAPVITEELDELQWQEDARDQDRRSS